MNMAHRTDDIQGRIVHEYDGIEEADNELPRWWLAIFYVSSAFALGYWFYYHEFEVAPTPRAAYQAEAERLAALAPKSAGELSDDALRGLPTDVALVAAGKALFTTNCAPCHGLNAEGKIGPNLTDKAWINGGDARSVLHSIAEGVPAKGMPGWKAVLGDEAVKQATAFVLSVRNTNAPGKEPQGAEFTGQ